MTYDKRSPLGFRESMGTMRSWKRTSRNALVSHGLAPDWFRSWSPAADSWSSRDCVSRHCFDIADRHAKSSSWT